MPGVKFLVIFFFSFWVAIRVFGGGVVSGFPADLLARCARAFSGAAWSLRPLVSLSGVNAMKKTGHYLEPYVFRLFAHLDGLFPALPSLFTFQVKD